MNIDFDITGSRDDEAYELKVLELCKFKNTQFNSADPTFGQIPNFFYHKINEQDPSTVLELSRESAFPSLYPLINEIGIDYKEFYTFSSNWEPSYFTKSIDKSQIEDVIGTRSMFERKSFFGSKYMKVPEVIILETFEPDPFVKGAIRQPDLIDGTFMYKDTPTVTLNKKVINSRSAVKRRFSKNEKPFLSAEKYTREIKKVPSTPTIEFYLFNQKRLMEYLFTPIKAQFEKYVNKLYGWGDLETLDDDVNQYIRENILKLYKVEKVDFYTLASREKVPSDYTTAELKGVGNLLNRKSKITKKEIDQQTGIKHVKDNYCLGVPHNSNSNVEWLKAFGFTKSQVNSIIKKSKDLIDKDELLKNNLLFIDYKAKPHNQTLIDTVAAYAADPNVCSIQMSSAKFSSDRIIETLYANRSLNKNLGKRICQVIIHHKSPEQEHIWKTADQARWINMLSYLL
jgi:hypothetical protein